MLQSKDILQFLGNIWYANGKKFNDTYLPMYVREITNTGATVIDLHNAEKTIIRENIPLTVVDICDIIREQMSLARPKLQNKQFSCIYCEGRGWVEGIKFDKNGIYTGYTFMLNCCCGQKQQPNMLVMKEDLSTNHKTETKDGYYRIFPNIVEKFKYLDKVEKNKWRDIK